MTIIAAAIRFPAKPDAYKPTVQDLILFVPAPGRHHNVLHSLWHQLKENDRGPRHVRTDDSYAGEVQGFLTDTGQFLNRKEAFKHVVECGQTLLVHPSRIEGTLYSEDLW